MYGVSGPGLGETGLMEMELAGVQGLLAGLDWAEDVSSMTYPAIHP